MLSENKIKHMLGVARRCYTLAKEENPTISEEEARLYWLMGFMHDIGYEFCDNDEHDSHPYKAYKLLTYISENPFNFNSMQQAIRLHGNGNKAAEANSYLKVLNEADLTVDYRGNDCQVNDRLKDIKERYGPTSKQYNEALLVAQINHML